MIHIALIIAALTARTPPPVLITNLHVVGLGEAPVGSGIFETRREISTIDSAGHAQDLWLVWLGEGQAMPHPGAICDFTYHLGRPELATDNRQDYKLIDRFICHTATPQGEGSLKR